MSGRVTSAIWFLSHSAVGNFVAEHSYRICPPHRKTPRVAPFPQHLCLASKPTLKSLSLERFGRLASNLLFGCGPPGFGPIIPPLKGRSQTFARLRLQPRALLTYRHHR